jgi:hypothetical protein
MVRDTTISIVNTPVVFGERPAILEEVRERSKPEMPS